MAQRRKNYAYSQVSISNAAGASKTGTAVDVSGSDDPAVCTKITNGATGPTVAASATIQVSHDGTNWYDFITVTAGTVANAVASWTHILPKSISYVRTNFTGNTVQAVTVEGVVTSYGNTYL